MGKQVPLDFGFNTADSSRNPHPPSCTPTMLQHAQSRGQQTTQKTDLMDIILKNVRCFHSTELKNHIYFTFTLHKVNLKQMCYLYSIQLIGNS